MFGSTKVSPKAKLISRNDSKGMFQNSSITAVKNAPVKGLHKNLNKSKFITRDDFNKMEQQKSAALVSHLEAELKTMKNQSNEMEYWDDMQKEIEKKSIKINDSNSNLGFSSLLLKKNNDIKTTTGDQTNSIYTSIGKLKNNSSQASQSMQKNTSIDHFNSNFRIVQKK